MSVWLALWLAGNIAECGKVKRRSVSILRCVILNVYAPRLRVETVRREFCPRSLGSQETERHNAAGEAAAHEWHKEVKEREGTKELQEVLTSGARSNVTLKSHSGT